MAATVPTLPVALRLALCSLVLSTTVVVVTSSSAAETSSVEPCKPDRLSVYKVLIKTYWSRERFPKHYPEFRPVAQFSKTLGRTHGGDYVLWKMGSVASKGVKDFAENGKSDLLDTDSQGREGVLDEFLLPNIPKGVGSSEATFFADGNHSKVSLIARIIPSPDWFIGIDGFDLCVLGKWVDVVTLELDPMDAGTDNGFTFTAPNWATVRPEPISRITAQLPNHAANSFHYPSLQKLPTIATVSFVKTKEYELSQTYDLKTNDVENVLPPKSKPKSPIENHLLRTGPQGTENKTDEEIGKGQSKKPVFSKEPRPRHCRVSKWSDWSSCSRTCGIGESRRTRKVLRQARRGGRPCPSLIETKWCGSARCSNTSYFDW